MSVDIVDDLHAAEDFIGQLQMEVKALATIRHHRAGVDDGHGKGGFNACHEEGCIVYQKLCEPFVRPTESADPEMVEDGNY